MFDFLSVAANQNQIESHIREILSIGETDASSEAGDQNPSITTVAKLKLISIEGTLQLKVLWQPLQSVVKSHCSSDDLVEQY